MIKWTKSQSRVLPREFTSQQTTDANIFVIGGYRTSSNENLVLKDCIQIDCNIQAYEREQMKTARYSAPLALIKDRFVLALGGYISKYNITKLSECYDTHTNTWFNIAPLPTQVVNATTVVMNERFVYLMPGTNRESQVGGSIHINMLDTGAPNMYSGDRSSRAYGNVIASQKWNQLEVKNADFVAAKPCAGIQTSSNEMLIFGGDTFTTFTFDTRDVA